MKKTLTRLLCIFLALIFGCLNASATEIIIDAKDAITEEFGFPFDLIVYDSYDETVDILVSLREEFKEVVEYELNVRHWLLGGSVFYKTGASDETLDLSGIELDREYPLVITLYYPEKAKHIDAKLTAYKDEADIKFEIDSQTIDDITEYNEMLDNTSELTDEEYSEIFELLDIPSFITEEQAKANKHLVRLIEFENSLDTIGFYNSDGTSTIYTFSSPIRYIDEDGTIKDYSADILPAAETVETEGYSYSNRFGDFTVNFSNELSNSKGTQIVSDSGKIEFGVYSVESSENSVVKDFVTSFKDFLTSDKQKASLVTEGTAQKIKYSKIGSQNYTIKSEPVINGAKLSIITDSAPHDNKLYVWINKNDLSVSPHSDEKNIYFTDKANELCYHLGYVEINDSNEAANCRISVNNQVCVIGTTKDQVLVEISLDSSFTQSPLTVYPIETAVYLTAVSTIENDEQSTFSVTQIEQSDLALASTSENSVAVYASAPEDTDEGYYVECEYDYPISYNFIDRTVYSQGAIDAATDSWLYAGSASSYWNGTSCIHNTAMFLMQYNTNSIATIDVETLKSAQVAIYSANSTVTDFENPVDLLRITDAWSENSLTQSHINKVESNYSGNLIGKDIYRRNYYSYFTVTEMVKDNILYQQNSTTGRPNYGFRISTQDHTAELLTFASKDHPEVAKRPMLVMKYVEYVFTPYTDTIRIKADPAYIKLDYGKSINISDSIVLLTKSGAPDTANTRLSYQVLNEELAEIREDQEGNIYAAAKQTKGLAIIKIQRNDTSDCAYITLDISMHIDIESGVSQEVINDDEHLEYQRNASIDYVLTIGGKEWDFIGTDLTEDDPFGEKGLANISKKAWYNSSKSFSSKELSYLYKLDPFGVVDYVHTKSTSFRTDGSAQSALKQIEYKIEVYTEIFDTPPKVYKENEAGTGYVVASAPLSVYNIDTHVSEAEFVFGISNRVTWTDIGRAMLDVVGKIAMGAIYITIPLSMVYSFAATNLVSAAFMLTVDVLYFGGTITVAAIASANNELEAEDILECATSFASVIFGVIQLNQAIKFSISQKANLKVLYKDGNIYLKKDGQLLRLSDGNILKYQPTSKVRISATSQKTTTILGSYADDMEHIISELKIPKSTDFDGNIGGFNVLNVQDHIYESLSKEDFWTQYNKVWLDKAIERDDIIFLATKPTDRVLYQSGFGREYRYLLSKGYIYCEELSLMIPT